MCDDLIDLMYSNDSSTCENVQSCMTNVVLCVTTDDVKSLFGCLPHQCNTCVMLSFKGNPTLDFPSQVANGRSCAVV